MAIPKIIYQTFERDNLSPVTRWHIYRLKKKNPGYRHEFFDNRRREEFIAKECDEKTLKLFKRINAGAAQADFFRYSILYKQGGIYIDIDSLIATKLDTFIKPDDHAIISKENNESGNFVQWGLIYEAGHPFLKRVIEKMMDNLRHNKYPFDVHKMTGPAMYTEAINECISENKNIPYRLMGLDYEGNLKFKFPFSKLMYKKTEHWKKDARPVLKPE